MKPLVLKRKVTDMKEIDVGFTHVAFVVRDLERSIAFYERYAGMTVIHRREPDVPDVRQRKQPACPGPLHQSKSQCRRR